MARKTASRLQKRREIEAAGSQARTKAARKKATKKRTTKRKAKAPERKRLFWGVFSGTMREEARFPYDQRQQAEEKLEQLRAKSKKLYFIQPIKELLSESAPAEAEDAEVADEEE